MRLPFRVVLSLLPLGLATLAGAAYVERSVLPAEGEVAEGVRLEGQPLARGEDANALVAARADALAARRVVVRHEGRELVDASLGELGADVDREAAVAGLMAVGRRGDWLSRVDDAWEARQGHRGVSLALSLPLEPLAERLLPIKDALDHKPVAARWDFAASQAVPHQLGVRVDLDATVDAVRRAARSLAEGALDVELVVHRTEPKATEAVVASVDRSQVVARYRTVFGYVGNQVGRAQNVARAAAGIDGLVMMPGEAISFNELVGPRSIDNGFAQAGEIYKGEMRMGIGGGTCQVASTFHAAAYLGGLSVVERSPHSRPSGYIPIGLDATVAYPHVDLVMQNPYPFPVVVGATIDPPGQLEVTIYGQTKPASVELFTATVGVKSYKRTIRVAHWLEEGQFRRKQAGRRGVTVEKTLTIVDADGHKRVLTTRDSYPPTEEIYYLAPGTDPGEALPPLPEDA
ncbi:MAG: VanW family protein [Myxococcales bacterium]|nr:VanW family protein [Myxococcales bacterium]